jgi:hypothetical protein
MLIELLAFTVVAVALAAPFVVPLMWGQIEQSSQDRAAAAQHEPSAAQPAKTLVGAVTVCAALIAASAFMHAADAKEFRQPRPADPERLRMIEECMAMNRKNTYSYSRMVEHMYHACMAEHGHHH